MGNLFFENSYAISYPTEEDKLKRKDAAKDWARPGIDPMKKLGLLFI